MIDSHCHLDHEPLINDLSNVIQRSKNVGIEKLLTISTSFESFNRVKDIVNLDDIIYGTIGIHPHEANSDIITSDEISTLSVSSDSELLSSGIVARRNTAIANSRTYMKVSCCEYVYCLSIRSRSYPLVEASN